MYVAGNEFNGHRNGMDSECPIVTHHSLTLHCTRALNWTTDWIQKQNRTNRTNQAGRQATRATHDTRTTLAMQCLSSRHQRSELSSNKGVSRQTNTKEGDVCDAVACLRKQVK